MRTRDHLANVRTFLAWARGALAMITVGYVIDKFDLIVTVVQHKSVSSTRTADRVVALVVVSMGICVLGGAYVRFLAARRMIESATFRPRPMLDLPLIGVAAIGGLVILGYLAKVGG